MRRLAAGISGLKSLPSIPEVAELDLSPKWIALIEQLTGGRRLRPVQWRAIEEVGVLDSRRNLVVSAPTNSGKSLIGYLLLFDAVCRGQRAVLLEPLRALAQEKADELRVLIDSIPQGSIGHGAQVRLTTGDYRLEGETFSEPPPDDGEIIVATPERLQAILRGDGVDEWTNQIGTVVVDEAHLVGSKHRGATLEFVVAAFLSTDSPPRIGLLSATIGSPEILSEWLEPCDTLVETQRFPQLEKCVLELEEDDEADLIIAQEVANELSDTEATVLVFVYQRAACEKLRRLLAEGSGGRISSEAFRPYHSGMSAAERRTTQEAMMRGEVRCVVATTSLALGVNLPATLVVVRDVTFFGSGKLKIDELLQMLGRAGRGNRAGKGLVVVKPNDGWTAAELREQLEQESLPELASSLVGAIGRNRSSFRESADRPELAELAGVIAGFLSRAGEDGMSLEDLQKVLSNTLAGGPLVDQIPVGVEWLREPGRSLAFEDERGHFHLTVLGKRGMRAALPVDYTAAFGQLLRDLLSIDPKNRTLSNWSILDHLLLTQLLTDRAPGLRRFSERLAQQVDGWMESQSQSTKSVLFRNWIFGDKENSKASELLGSLGIVTSTKGSGPEDPKCRARAYLATFSAILLLERASGKSLSDLVARWDLKSASVLAGTEESWRDATIWLVSGQGSLCEVRSFYHHLLSDCEADKDRILLSETCLRSMKNQSHDLQEMLRYCSPLGVLLRGVRSGLSNSKTSAVGIGTIRRLEDAGFQSIGDLVGKTMSDLTDAGVQKRYAKQIVSYVRRRQR